MGNATAFKMIDSVFAVMKLYKRQIYDEGAREEAAVLSTAANTLGLQIVAGVILFAGPCSKWANELIIVQLGYLMDSATWPLQIANI